MLMETAVQAFTVTQPYVLGATSADDVNSGGVQHFRGALIK